jgi:hypothetical protein
MRVGELGVKVAEMENDLEDTKESLEEDKKFLGPQKQHPKYYLDYVIDVAKNFGSTWLWFSYHSEKDDFAFQEYEWYADVADINLMMVDYITEKKRKDVVPKDWSVPYRWMRPMLDIHREEHAAHGNGVPTPTVADGTEIDKESTADETVKMILERLAAGRALAKQRIRQKAAEPERSAPEEFVLDKHSIEDEYEKDWTLDAVTDTKDKKKEESEAKQKGRWADAEATEEDEAFVTRLAGERAEGNAVPELPPITQRQMKKAYKARKQGREPSGHRDTERQLGQTYSSNIKLDGPNSCEPPWRKVEMQDKDEEDNVEKIAPLRLRPVAKAVLLRQARNSSGSSSSDSWMRHVLGPAGRGRSTTIPAWMTNGVSNEKKPEIPNAEEEAKKRAAPQAPNVLDEIFRERDSSKGKGKREGKREGKGKSTRESIDNESKAAASTAAVAKKMQEKRWAKIQQPAHQK